MVSTKYLLTLLVAFLASSFFAGLGYFRGQEINIFTLGFSFVFAVAYVPLVIIRLPVFRSYYVKDKYRINKTLHNFATYRAAPVMVGLFAGITLAILFNLINVPNPGYHSFYGAVTALVISYYYEPKIF